MSRARVPAGLKHVAINKLPTAARKVGGRRMRLPWRKTTHVRRKLTYPEKRALLAKRLKKKVDLGARLKEIREYVFNQAIVLKEEFGGHDVKWYYRLIMQQSNYKFTDPQEITLWNAFVSKGFREHNEGE